MTVNELISVVRCDIDAKTGQKISHREKYGRIIEKLGGIEAIIPMIPYGFDRLRDSCKDDQHFNDLPMRPWQLAAGFICASGDCVAIGSPLKNLLYRHGVTIMSCSENVCILKETARLWVERDESVRVSDLI